MFGRAYNNYARFFTVGTACTALLILAILGRYLFLLAGVGSVGFWDQWGGESGLFAPFLDGNLTLSQLIAPHNEHRILWTRLLTLAIFEINDRQWDNAVEAIISNAIYCLAMLIPLRASARSGSNLIFAIVATTIALNLFLPIGWENTLVGFQSQFYISQLSAFSAIYLCAFSPVRPLIIVAIIGICSASLFSMANGTLIALACVGVIGLRIFDKSFPPLLGFLAIAALLLIACIGVLLTPDLPHHQILKAKGIIEHIQSFLVAASWPLQQPWGVAIWTPAVAWLIVQRTLPPDASSRFFWGVLLLAAMNIVAIAHSRGHGMDSVTSRYTDTVYLSVIGNAYFAALLIARMKNIGARIVLGLLPLVAISIGLAKQSISQFSKATERAFLTRAETVNTARFLAGDESAFIDQPTAYVPYPDAKQLGDSLRRSDQTAHLPTSILGAVAVSNPQKLLSIDRTCIAVRDTSLKTKISCEKNFKLPEQAIAIPTGRLSAYVMQTKDALDLTLFSRSSPISNFSASGTRCSVDLINNKPASSALTTVDGNMPLRLAGWSQPFGPQDHLFFGNKIRVILSSETSSFRFDAGRRWVHRPDVADALKDKRYRYSGFDAFIDIRNIPPGTYRILTGAGSNPLCETGHAVSISGEKLPFAQY